MPTIKVRVVGKIAENLTPEVKIVCRNSDYKVEFEFDEPWQKHELKTALFVYNGASVPVPFSGNVCEMPELYNTTLCAIGVFAGDLITTTPAYVDCLKAISDLGGEMPPPTEDVYNKLVQMIESGMLKGEQGEKGEKGDKGEAGAIKFIPVNELPTENIENAVYLLPLENAEEENRYTEYIYINGKWEKFGEISLQVDHSEYAKKAEVNKALDNKLDKFEEKSGLVRFYAVNADGSQTMNWTLATTARASDVDKIPKYFTVDNAQGDIQPLGVLLCNTPQKPYQTTNKDYVDTALDNKLDKVTTAYKLYGTDHNGSQQVFSIGNTYGNSMNRSIPWYFDTDNVQLDSEPKGSLITATPKKPFATVNKKYVDDILGEIETALDRIIAIQNSLIGGETE